MVNGDWRNDSEQAPKEPPKKRRLSRGVVTGDVASQVHGARHPTGSYAPEPLTASCLHASVAVLTKQQFVTPGRLRSQSLRNHGSERKGEAQRLLYDSIDACAAHSRPSSPSIHLQLA